MIVFDHVAFSFGHDNWTLSVPELHIHPGELIAIVGENGSGKSTLARLAAGLYAPTEGTVKICGFDTASPQESFQARSHIGFVFQNPDDQLVAALVEDEVAFGPQNLGLLPDEVHVRVKQALQRVGLEGLEQRETATLSGGQKQRLAIAGALAMHPQVLLLDEASSMLDPQGRQSLMQLCQDLHKEGIAVVLVTHFMDEAANAERIIALHEGELVANGTPEEVLTNQALLKRCRLKAPFAVQLCDSLHERHIEIDTCCTEQKLIEALIARKRAIEDRACEEMSDNETRHEAWADSTEAGAQSPSTNASSEHDSKSNAAACISFNNLGFTYDEFKKRAKLNWVLHELSFSIRQGECLGIAGHTGSGKSTLLSHMNGLLRPQQGCVWVAGRRLETKKDRAWAISQVGLVFQYPERQLFASSVLEDVMFGPRNLGLSPSEAKESSLRALELVGLDPASIAERNPFKLSGGQQRRVALAGILAMQPRVLVLDEPGAGLDPESHHELMQLIDELRRQENLTLVIASHDMDELNVLCDRVLVLDHGTVAALDTPETAFQQVELLQKLGLDAPRAERFAQNLAKAGLPLPSAPHGTLHDLESVASALEAVLQQS